MAHSYVLPPYVSVGTARVRQVQLPVRLILRVTDTAYLRDGGRLDVEVAEVLVAPALGGSESVPPARSTIPLEFVFVERAIQDSRYDSIMVPIRHQNPTTVFLQR